LTLSPSSTESFLLFLFLKKMKKIKTKVCPYCGVEFTDIDSPRSFDRMVTCGSVECMGERRKEMRSIRQNSERSDLIES
jgi:hypothetical protein